MPQLVSIPLPCAVPKNVEISTVLPDMVADDGTALKISEFTAVSPGCTLLIGNVPIAKYWLNAPVPVEADPMNVSIWLRPFVVMRFFTTATVYLSFSCRVRPFHQLSQVALSSW